MKRISTLDIKTDGSLKVKRCILVITSCEGSSNSNEKIEGGGQASFYLVTIREADNLENETESAEAPKTFENAKDFQQDPTYGKFLKRHFS